MSERDPFCSHIRLARQLALLLMQISCFTASSALEIVSDPVALSSATQDVSFDLAEIEEMTGLQIQIDGSATLYFRCDTFRGDQDYWMKVCADTEPLTAFLRNNGLPEMVPDWDNSHYSSFMVFAAAPQMWRDRRMDAFCDHWWTPWEITRYSFTQSAPHSFPWGIHGVVREGSSVLFLHGTVKHMEGEP